jgi:hypothetical protein
MPASPETEENTHGGPPPMPRWVKVAGTVVGILVLLFVVLKLTDVGGEHGPGRHTSRAGAPVATVVQEHARPADSQG